MQLSFLSTECTSSARTFNQHAFAQTICRLHVYACIHYATLCVCGGVISMLQVNAPPGAGYPLNLIFAHIVSPQIETVNVNTYFFCCDFFRWVIWENSEDAVFQYMEYHILYNDSTYTSSMINLNYYRINCLKNCQQSSIKCFCKQLLLKKKIDQIP